MGCGLKATSHFLIEDELINIFDKLGDPETRNKIFTIADSLIGEKPVITSDREGNSDSDFSWIVE